MKHRPCLAVTARRHLQPRRCHQATMATASHIWDAVVVNPETDWTCCDPSGQVRDCQVQFLVVRSFPQSCVLLHATDHRQVAKYDLLRQSVMGATFRTLAFGALPRKLGCCSEGEFVDALVHHDLRDAGTYEAQRPTVGCVQCLHAPLDMGGP